MWQVQRMKVKNEGETIVNNQQAYGTNNGDGVESIHPAFGKINGVKDQYKLEKEESEENRINEDNV